MSNDCEVCGEPFDTTSECDGPNAYYADGCHQGCYAFRLAEQQNEQELDKW